MKIDFSKYPLPKRLRHHTASNLYIPVSELKMVTGYYPPVYNEIDWKNIYKNGLPPDALDIGCGKGAFLLEYSLLHPGINILGIELRKLPVEWLSNIIKSENINNCAILWYSASNGFPFLDSSSIKQIFYLFPDPWHKRKHRKRRTFSIGFLDELHRIMTDDAELSIATDVKEVDGYHQKTLEKHGSFTYKVIDDDNEWELPITNKEKFCRDNNIEFYRLKCRKR
jgi:tRNA (guanine-N7-)-methyltransferase